MTVTRPPNTLAAEDYWTADQLRVMRGLDLPIWFRPAASEQVGMVEKAKTAEAIAMPQAVEQTQYVEPAQCFDAEQFGVKTHPVEHIELVQNPALSIVHQHYPWLVIASQPLSVDAQRLWANMLTSVEKNESSAYVFELPSKVSLANDPFSDVSQATLEHIQLQVDAMQPKLVIALGEQAAQILLGVDSDLQSMRGELHELDGLPVLVIQHPDKLLLTPQLKAQAWHELNLI